MRTNGAGHGAEVDPNQRGVGDGMGVSWGQGLRRLVPSMRRRGGRNHTYPGQLRGISHLGPGRTVARHGQAAPLANTGRNCPHLRHVASAEFRVGGERGQQTFELDMIYAEFAVRREVYGCTNRMATT